MDLNRARDIGPVNRHRSALALVFLSGLLLVSCGPDRMQGRAVLSGSSTLAPWAARVVEGWKKKHPSVESRVEAIGSDAGLERLVRYNDADLALVSRPLTEADRSAAAAVGKTLVPFLVARDAVSLVVPVSNTWARNLSREQTVRAFTSAQLWSDLDPSWPARPIHRFVLGPNSGTAEVFAVQVFGGIKDPLYQAEGAQASEDDTILARGVTQVDDALGFLGWSSLRGAGPGLRSVAFDGVEPNATTIADLSYGLPRPLWLVATKEGLETNSAARDLIQYVFDNYEALTAETGLVALTEIERTAVHAALP